MNAEMQYQLAKIRQRELQQEAEHARLEALALFCRPKMGSSLLSKIAAAVRSASRSQVQPGRASEPACAS